ncbi:hypothetical protein [Agrococcus sp. Ld7]|uniref:hypothetical protein n=1 Tax=Agrococcus sp. Ld7 TaxID=649148 RepID=UPI0038698EA0
MSNQRQNKGWNPDRKARAMEPDNSYSNDPRIARLLSSLGLDDAQRETDAMRMVPLELAPPEAAEVRHE